MPRPKLTEELIEEICNYLIGGAYEHVACEAAGISYEQYSNWLARGKTEIGAGYKFHRYLVKRTRRAKAIARLLAETAVKKEHPQSWLKYGPGREQVDKPGWSREVKPVVVEDNRSINIMTSPEWLKIWQLMMSTLEPFPEAKIAVAGALVGVERDSETVLIHEAVPVPESLTLAEAMTASQQADIIIDQYKETAKPL